MSSGATTHQPPAMIEKRTAIPCQYIPVGLNLRPDDERRVVENGQILHHPWIRARSPGVEAQPPLLTQLQLPQRRWRLRFSDASNQIFYAGRGPHLSSSPPQRLTFCSWGSWQNLWQPSEQLQPHQNPITY